MLVMGCHGIKAVLVMGLCCLNALHLANVESAGWFPDTMCMKLSMFMKSFFVKSRAVAVDVMLSCRLSVVCENSQSVPGKLFLHIVLCTVV